jgi:hypothetical protein
MLSGHIAQKLIHFLYADSGERPGIYYNKKNEAKQYGE